MPSRHALKTYVKGGYYHVYNRGNNMQDIFLDIEDKEVFLNHLKRHLSKEIHKNIHSREYANLRSQVRLLGYCLMSNHFHLLLFQEDPRGIEMLTRRIMGSYSNYFNQKYGRVGPLYQGRYKARMIDNLEYSRKILRYIHRNPKDIVSDWRQYEYSSYGAYQGRWCATWLDTDHFLDY